MSYDVDDLFWIVESDREATLMQYREKTYSAITELEIPEEYNGKPVVCIWDCVFEDAKYLKSVRLPKSIKEIRHRAFWNCPELECLELNSSPTFHRNAVGLCPKLPPEMIVMGLVGSTDITRPLPPLDFGGVECFVGVLFDDCFRPDVFELLAKNNCFRYFEPQHLFKIIIAENKSALLPAAEQYGMLESAELVDKLIDYAAEDQKVEITAYLLDLKKRKFGFNGGGDFEL